LASDEEDAMSMNTPPKSPFYAPDPSAPEREDVPDPGPDRTPPASAEADRVPSHEAEEAPRARADVIEPGLASAPDDDAPAI
jgi:hypothetical protein